MDSNIISFTLCDNLDFSHNFWTIRAYHIIFFTVSSVTRLSRYRQIRDWLDGCHTQTPFTRWFATIGRRRRSFWTLSIVSCWGWLPTSSTWRWYRRWKCSNTPSIQRKETTSLKCCGWRVPTQKYEHLLDILISSTCYFLQLTAYFYFYSFFTIFSIIFVCVQVWYDRRLNYTRSLAVMSMVGYVLGLGDR